MNEVAMNLDQTCPCCPRGCSLSAPSCDRGKHYAVQLAGGGAPQQHSHGEHHGPHGAHGPHGGAMPAPDSLEGLLRRCGHALHHGAVGQGDLFAALSPEEQASLRALLQKLTASWER